MDWLDDLKFYTENRQDISQNFEHFFELIAEGMKDPSKADQALEGLNLIFPYALARSDYHRWQSTLNQAVHHGEVLLDNQIKTQAAQHLGLYYLKLGRFNQASQAFISAYEQAAHTGQQHTMALLARLGLLRAEAVYNQYQFRSHIVGEITLLLPSITDPLICALAYHVLATHHLYNMDYVRALELEQYALVLYRRYGTSINVIEPSYTLVEICRNADLIPAALRFLSYGHAYVKGAASKHQIAFYAFERGAMLLDEGDKTKNNAALYWLDVALKLFEEAGDFPGHIAAVQQTMGLAQIYDGAFEEAQMNLETALTHWEAMDNRYEQINAL